MAAAKLDVVQTLRRIPLFQQLSPEQLDRLAARTHARRLGKGEVLFHKGDAPRGVHAVVVGQIKLAFPSLGGSEKVVEIIGPQQSFGEAVMFMGRPYPVSAESLGDSVVVEVERSAVFEMLEADRSFSHRMLAGLSLRLHNLVRDVESYSVRSSAQRVIGFLLQSAATKSAESVEIDLPTTKQVIASRLNLTPETLSRVFHDLAAAGLISVRGKRVTVHDVARLRDYEP